MTEPKFDKNGWCSDMSLAPSDGVLLVREERKEGNSSAFCYNVFTYYIGGDEDWTGTHWKLINPPMDSDKCRNNTEERD